MPDEMKTEADAIAELSAKPFSLNFSGIPYLFMPKEEGGWSYQQVGPRKQGTARLDDVESFTRFVTSQGVPARTNIYIEFRPKASCFSATAVFNDHGSFVESEAGWLDHRAVFTPAVSHEWEKWIRHDGEWFRQEDFGHFLEINISDIATGDNLPSGSDVLSFVTALNETRTVKYGSAVNLQNGMVQIEFTEQSGNAEKGKLEVFSKFAIGIAPFELGDAYRIDAFLRYRIDRNSGEIKFSYDLKNPEKVFEDAAKDMAERIKAHAGFPVFFGKP